MNSDNLFFPFIAWLKSDRVFDDYPITIKMTSFSLRGRHSILAGRRTFLMYVDPITISQPDPD